MRITIRTRDRNIINRILSKCCNIRVLINIRIVRRSRVRAILSTRIRPRITIRVSPRHTPSSSPSRIPNLSPRTCLIFVTCIVMYTW